MYKSQKIALDPTFKQRQWFSQQCGYARFAYNHALADFKSGLDRNDFQSWIDLNRNFNQVKKEYDWASSQDQRASKYSIQNLGQAVKNWKDKTAKFPKFKKRGSNQSYTTDEQSVCIEGKRIKLTKIGWIKMCQSLRFDGKIVKVTVSRTAHRWFVSIIVDIGTPKIVERSTDPIVGIDVGINTLATLDDGTKYDNPRPLKRYERKLKRAQRSLSRKKFLSNNWYKQKAKVARIYYRITCIRTDAHHKASTDIIRRSGSIAIETLKVTNMLKNRKLAKALSDSALGGFLSKLKTKAESLGIPIFQAPQFFASSKTCSNCGYKNKELKLSDRVYACDRCLEEIDRDINAAINLKQLAVGYTDSINDCG